MDRRQFLHALGATAVAGYSPGVVWAGPAGRYENLLILVELKGGNDGLNTVVPYADGEYYNLRPRIAIARDQGRKLRIGRQRRVVAGVWRVVAIVDDHVVARLFG